MNPHAPAASAQRLCVFVLTCAALVAGACDDGDRGAVSDGQSSDTTDTETPTAAAPFRWRERFTASSALLLDFDVQPDGRADLFYWDDTADIGTLVTFDAVGNATVAQTPLGSRDETWIARSGDVIHVAWRSGDELFWALGNASQGELVAPSDRTARLAVGGDGTPYLAFIDGSTLRFAERKDGNWALSEVIPLNATTLDLVTIGDEPVIGRVGNQLDGDHVEIYRRNGEQWNMTVVGPRHDAFAWIPHFEVAADGTVYLAIFGDDDDGNVIWSSSDLATWETSPIYGRRIARDFALDGAGKPILALENSRASLREIALFFVASELSQPFVGEECTLRIDTAPGATPLAAASCGNGSLVVLEVDDTYPNDWAERCAAAGDALCGEIDACGGECAFSDQGTSCGTCELPAELCANPTRTEAELETCASATASGQCRAEGTDVGYELPPACAALLE